MGNNESIKKFKGDFQIQTDKNFYFPGENISLKIFIKNPKPLKEAIFTFKIYQREYWEVNKTNIINIKSLDKEENINNVYSETRQFYELINNKEISKGIELVFNIQLPNYLIPSLEYPLYEKMACVRTYIIVSLNELLIEKKFYLMINKPPSSLSSPLKMTFPFSNKILSLFIKDNGIIEATYPTNNYSFYNNIPLNLHIDLGKENVSSITTKLIRKVKFLHNGKENNDLLFKDELFTIDTQITQKVTDINLNILICEPENIFNKYIYNPDGIQVQDKTQLIYLVPSIDTNLIKVEYYIQLIPNFNSLINVNFKKKEMKIPLLISHHSIYDENNKFNNSIINSVEKELNAINSNIDVNEIPSYQEVMSQSQINNPSSQINNQFYSP